MASIEERIQKKMLELRQKEEETAIEQQAMKRLLEEKKKEEEEKKKKEDEKKLSETIGMIIDDIERATETNDLTILAPWLNQIPHKPRNRMPRGHWVSQENVVEYLQEASRAISKHLLEKEERKEQERWEKIQKGYEELSDEALLTQYDDMYRRRSGQGLTFIPPRTTKEINRAEESKCRGNILREEVWKRYGRKANHRDTLQRIRTERLLKEKQQEEKEEKMKQLEEMLNTFSREELTGLLSKMMGTGQ